MSNVDKNRLEEFFTRWETTDYTLYVRDGKAVRIKYSYYSDHEAHDYLNNKNNKGFWHRFKIIVYSFCKNNDIKSLKKLYNSLNEGDCKRYVEKSINELIDFYEKAIADLKS